MDVEGCSELGFVLLEKSVLYDGLEVAQRLAACGFRGVDLSFGPLKQTSRPARPYRMDGESEWIMYDTTTTLSPWQVGLRVPSPRCWHILLLSHLQLSVWRPMRWLLTHYL